MALAQMMQWPRYLPRNRGRRGNLRCIIKPPGLIFNNVYITRRMKVSHVSIVVLLSVSERRTGRVAKVLTVYQQGVPSGKAELP